MLLSSCPAQAWLFQVASATPVDAAQQVCEAALLGRRIPVRMACSLLYNCKICRPGIILCCCESAVTPAQLHAHRQGPPALSQAAC